jgi:secondary thiamine-phosphate synthase enzyme
MPLTIRTKLVTHPVRTTGRNQMLDVTSHLQKLMDREQVYEGMIVVFVPHTTAAITINENADPDVKTDMLTKLSSLIPQRDGYDHAEGNSDSHVKASLVGNSVTVLIEGGHLLLGQWQGVYFCEFDGPRERQMHVKIVNFRFPTE